MLWFDLVIRFAALARGMNASGSVAISLSKKISSSGVNKEARQREGEKGVPLREQKKLF